MEKKKSISGTKAPSSTGNTKARARSWIIVTNNPKDSDIVSLRETFKKAEHWVIGFETGKEGTKHLQAYGSWKNAKRFTTLKKLLPRSHLEIARGTWIESFKYCTKEKDPWLPPEFSDDPTKGDLSAAERIMKEILARYSTVKWKPWQAEIIKLCEAPPDPRKIYWFWEDTGNVGKSFLALYMSIKWNSIVVEGKKADILHSLYKLIHEDDLKPELAIIDCPRDSLKWINYSVLEKIKDGLAYSGKYEGCRIYLPLMHVIVFANVPPEEDKMSKDRWVITHIDAA